jgi:ComF family protein
MVADETHIAAAGHLRQRNPLLRTAGWIMDILIPPACLSCHTLLATHDSLCAACWRDIAFIRPPLCDRLGLPMPYGGSRGADGQHHPLISAAAAADPPPWDRARAVAVFGGVMRDLVHGFKYADRHDPRRLLGQWLTEAGWSLFPGTHVIVPVPLTRWRLMRRQFNQSALLALEVARHTGIHADTAALVKTRTTPPQMGLTRQQRLANVRGAFLVPPRRRPSIAGRNVLLIDDVITTGATVGAATRALREAGAARVDVLALALVTDASAVTI